MAAAGEASRPPMTLFHRDPDNNGGEHHSSAGPSTGSLGTESNTWDPSYGPCGLHGWAPPCSPPVSPCPATLSEALGPQSVPPKTGHMRVPVQTHRHSQRQRSTHPDMQRWQHMHPDTPCAIQMHTHHQHTPCTGTQASFPDDSSALVVHLLTPPPPAAPP